VVSLKKVNPKALGPAVGYSHGVRHGDTLHVAGQIGGTPKGDGSWTVRAGIAAQFEKALENVVEVVREEGGAPDSIAEMVIFVKDMEAYRKARKEIGVAWKRIFGKHYPAITMVEVSDLFEPGTLVEIRAVAALGGSK
jgi:enamine deaminase RidA (YjgF/YER057c/UK114 family)